MAEEKLQVSLFCPITDSTCRSNCVFYMDEGGESDIEGDCFIKEALRIYLVENEA